MRLLKFLLSFTILLYVLIHLYVLIDVFQYNSGAVGFALSLEDAKMKKLYIHTYAPIKKIYEYNGKKYKIDKAWTSYSFSNRKQDSINKDKFEFYFKVYNLNSNINFINEGHVYSRNNLKYISKKPRLERRIEFPIGERNGHLYLEFFNKSEILSLDTITIKFGQIDTIYFIKQN
ncbi:MAG: hypothetical protein ACK5UE_05300 [Chitinophagales bacterium]